MIDMLMIQVHPSGVVGLIGAPEQAMQQAIVKLNGCQWDKGAECGYYSGTSDALAVAVQPLGLEVVDPERIGVLIQELFPHWLSAFYLRSREIRSREHPPKFSNSLDADIQQRIKDRTSPRTIVALLADLRALGTHYIFDAASLVLTSPDRFGQPMTGRRERVRALRLAGCRVGLLFNTADRLDVSKTLRAMGLPDTTPYAMWTQPDQVADHRVIHPLIDVAIDSVMLLFSADQSSTFFAGYVFDVRPSLVVPSMPGYAFFIPNIVEEAQRWGGGSFEKGDRRFARSWGRDDRLWGDDGSWTLPEPTISSIVIGPSDLHPYVEARSFDTGKLEALKRWASTLLKPESSQSDPDGTPEDGNT